MLHDDNDEDAVKDLVVQHKVLHDDNDVDYDDDEDEV